MKQSLTILFLFTSLLVHAQKKSDIQQSEKYRNIAKQKVEVFLDSVKATLLRDTVQFSRTNLIHSAGVTHNTKLNSPFFIINGQFSYKVDIVEGKEVVKFTKEVLNARKVKSITVVLPNYSRALYGSLGTGGAILITLKKKAQFNPQVAGLTLPANHNFDQRKPGEVTIRP